jgi:molecular chaperone DnaK (HSP70)
VIFIKLLLAGDNFLGGADFDKLFLAYYTQVILTDTGVDINLPKYATTEYSQLL